MADGFSPFHVPQQSRRDKLRVNSDNFPPLVPLYGGNLTNSAVNDERSLFTVVDPQLSVQSNPSYYGVVLSNEPKSLSLELNLQRYDVVSCNGNGPFTGYASVLKGSRFLKPAQMLLEELCGVVGNGGFDTSSSVWDPPPLENSLSDQTGIFVDGDDGSVNCHQTRKKSMLISLLDEVCKRYKQYCHQIQSVIASFESVAGLRGAAPFTNWAVKAMSKHFKCLKNAITDQLTTKSRCNINRERDETLRLANPRNDTYGHKLFHSPGYADQPVWRPQRGLPERAVSVLRAWLFDHFLHPYPTDTDKLMLAKQTGLSRNQVSNWFINARVRLWKPMVEEIHMLEIGQNKQASKKEEHPSNRLTDHLTANCSTESANASTSIQQFPSKRTRDESLLPSVGQNGLMKMQYANLLPNPHSGFGLSNGGSSGGGGNGNVSLTLGLHQNGGGLSESYPMNAARRFGLDSQEESGYVASEFGAQNRQFMYDFVG